MFQLPVKRVLSPPSVVLSALMRFSPVPVKVLLSVFPAPVTFSNPPLATALANVPLLNESSRLAPLSTVAAPLPRALLFAAFNVPAATVVPPV